MPNDPHDELKANRKIAWDRATEFLNKSNEELIADIFFYSKDKLTQNPNEQVGTTLAVFSSLLIKLSWQAEESTRKTIKLTEETMKYTKRLHRLTVAIVILTIVLLFQGFFELPKVPINFSQHANQEKQQAQQDNLANKPKPTVPAVKK